MNGENSIKGSGTVGEMYKPTILNELKWPSELLSINLLLIVNIRKETHEEIIRELKYCSSTFI